MVEGVFTRGEMIEKPNVQIYPIKLCSIGGLSLIVRDVIKVTKQMGGAS